MTQQYRGLPEQVAAQQNEWDEPRQMQDSQGGEWTVPAGWWLVEGKRGTSMLSPEAFGASFERYEAPAGLDGFLNTVQDLRNSDRAHDRRLNELDDRLAAVERLAASLPGA